MDVDVGGDADGGGSGSGRIEEERGREGGRGSLALGLPRDSGEYQDQDQESEHPWVGMGRVAAFEERLGLGREARMGTGAGESTQSLPLDRVGNVPGARNESAPDLLGGRDLDGHGHGDLAPPPLIQMHNEDEGMFQDSIMSTMITIRD